MGYQKISLNVEGGVGRLTMKRPEVRNAFDPAMIAEITHAATELNHDQKLRFLLIKGEGKVFSAGADLDWMKSMNDVGFDENLEDARVLARLFQSLYDLPFPVIALTHGAAMGGGAGLVSVADHVVAHPDTRFAFSEAALGLVPAVISPYVIAKIGISAANSLFTSARRFDVEYALKIGLIHEISDSEDVETQVCETYLKSAPAAARRAKALCRKIQHESFDPRTQSDYCSRMIAECRSEEEARIGIEALFDKKAPPWQENS